MVASRLIHRPRWLESLYLLVATVVIAVVLSRFAAIIDNFLRIKYNWLTELAMVTGQVLFQWVFLWRRPIAVKWQYALQVISVSLMGAMLLVPLIVWHLIQPVSVAAALVYFFAVVAIMFADHWRRVKRMNLPWHLCATWVLYRCLLLVLIVRWPID